MPLVDKLLAVAIKYLQKKQKSLRKGAQKKKDLRRKKLTKPKRPKSAPKAPAKRPLKKQRPALLGKKPQAKPAPAKAKPIPQKLAGVVTHYFARIEVVVIALKKSGLKVGETIHIKGKTTDFTQQVKSLQIESVNVASAKKGALVGLKVVKEAKEGDKVYIVG